MKVITASRPIKSSVKMMDVEPGTLVEFINADARDRYGVVLVGNKIAMSLGNPEFAWSWGVQGSGQCNLEVLTIPHGAIVTLKQE